MMEYEGFESIETLLEKHAPLVRGQAKDFRARSGAGVGLEWEDLMQEGNLALWKAWKTFDPTREVQFKTYATTVIRNELNNYGRKFWGKQAVPIDDLDRLENMPRTAGAEDVLMEWEIKRTMSDLLEQYRGVYKGKTAQEGLQALILKMEEHRAVDIAKHWGVGQKRVNSSVGYVREKLRKEPEIQEFFGIK